MSLGNIVKMGTLLVQMKHNQWKTQDDLESMQEEKLRQLVSYASENVAYYKNLKKNLKDLDDLSNLPLVTKKAIRENADSFLSRRFDKSHLKKLPTSGSTGMPLSVYHHPDESKYGPAFEVRQLAEAGVTPFDVHAWVTADPYNQNILNKLGLFRRHHFLFSNSRQLGQIIF